MQLYNHIRAKIQDGVLKDGSKLPSIRALKQQLNISKTTVETAYHMLIEEGYVRSKERSGLIVVNPQPLLTSYDSTFTKKHETKNKPSGLAIREGFIDFSLLTVDRASFPIRIWKSIVGESLSLHAQSVHEYGDPYGELTLRECVAQYLRQSRGVECSPEQIVIGTGIAYSVQILSRLLGEDAFVGIEKSGIAQVRRIFKQNRFQLIPLSIQDSGSWEDEMERKNLRLLYVTPSHRPTGDPLPYSIRQRMLQWAYRNDGYIIEDDYDGELRLSGKPVPSLQGLDNKGVVIYVGTFSKVFTPAIRMNYMVLPLELLDKLKSLDQILSCPSRMDQWGMELFIARGHWYRHLRRMRKIYRLKHEAIVHFIRSYMQAAVNISSSGTGLHVELSIAAPVGAETLIELARNVGVLVYGNHDPQPPGELPKIYLGFGGIDIDEMEQGVRLLSQAWSKLFEP